MDLLEKLDKQEIQRLYELYVLDCEQVGTHPSISDFSLYLEEQYES